MERDQLENTLGPGKKSFAFSWFSGAGAGDRIEKGSDAKAFAMG
jgi:hypothetical protein